MNWFTRWLHKDLPLEEYSDNFKEQQGSVIKLKSELEEVLESQEI